METTLIRPTFVWTPNDTTDFTLIWEEGKSEGDGAAWTSVSPNESWQVSIYGKNISDQPNYGKLTSIAGLYIAGPMQKGRIYGLEVNFRMN